MCIFYVFFVVLQRAPSYRKVSHKILALKYWPLTEKSESEESIPPINEVCCIECVKVVPVASCEDLEPGDHVIICGTVYDHHGILHSKKGNTLKIIEATNTVSGFIIGVLRRGIWGKANIRITEKEFDFRITTVCVVEYKHRYTKEITIQRAEDFQCNKANAGNYTYSLLGNNCEHFATHCATGKQFSVQVSKFTLMRDMFSETRLLGFNDELARNNALYKKHLICKECYDMNKYLLEVSIKPVLSAEDITKGDIIRFSYWNFWHEAVILEKEEKEEEEENEEIDQNIVVCSIAHYAFFGPFSFRTIAEEKIKIRLDGQTFKLEYNSPQYSVFKPDEVVERARRRIGEQLFSFYSNDSSHFVRWCKLALLKTVPNFDLSLKKMGILIELVKDLRRHLSTFDCR